MFNELLLRHSRAKYPIKPFAVKVFPDVKGVLTVRPHVIITVIGKITANGSVVIVLNDENLRPILTERQSLEDVQLGSLYIDAYEIDVTCLPWRQVLTYHAVKRHHRNIIFLKTREIFTVLLKVLLHVWVHCR
jgi:hypothetical protein